MCLNVRADRTGRRLPAGDDELQDELVARIIAGERPLFGLLYQRYRSRTFALAYGMTGQREQAEDLTQEIFLRVFERLKTFQGRTPDTIFSSVRESAFGFET